MRIVLPLSVLALLFSSLTTSLGAQGLHAKIQARKAEAEKPKTIKAAIQIKVTRSYQSSYDDVLNWMKKSEFAVDFANSNKENGIVASTIETVGSGALNWKKTGRRLTVELVKENEAETILKVAVVYLQRIGADSWSTKPKDIKFNAEETNAVIDKMKSDLYTAPEIVH